MLIRRLSLIEELNLLAQIDRQVNQSPWSAENYHQALANPCQQIYGVFNASADLVAGGVFSQVSDQGEILQLCSAVQRCGYARKLLHNIFLDMRQAGVKEIFLEVRINNLAAINLYQSEGFNQAAIRKNYYLINQQRVDAMLMVKTLCL